LFRFIYHYAECHYADCHYTQYRYAECRSAAIAQHRKKLAVILYQSNAAIKASAFTSLKIQQKTTAFTRKSAAVSESDNAYLKRFFMRF
jgi:hypothetical protein